MTPVAKSTSTPVTVLSALPKISSNGYRAPFPRRRIPFRSGACLCTLAAALLGSFNAGAADTLDAAKLPPPATVQVDFTRDVQPLLEAHCLKCHSGEKPKADFRLTSREAALRGGRNGVDIIPGQSGKSVLIYAVAGQIEDLQMPPPGRGTPLTLEQVALLRAWIDQGVSWASITNAPVAQASVSPTVGFTTVNGDARKFRELYWQHEGWNGGLEQFEMTEQAGPDARITASGHVLRDDYALHLSAEKNDLGFTRFGWSQFRKYYDDEGGYDPLITPSSYGLNRDLNLDIGRAWAEIGLTLPQWPTAVLGYEYQYRDGTEATLQWGPVNESDPRNIYPGFKSISERVNILKLDLDYTLAGVSLNDSFRAEWYHLATSEADENLASSGATSLPFTRIDEQQRYFEGANTFHAEKQFTDWLFGAGGYLYSKLDADGSVGMQQLNLAQLSPASVGLFDWNSSGLELERESHVFSLSALLGPWQGLSLSLGTQNEWTRESGFGIAAVQFSSLVLGPPYSVPLGLQTDLSQLDHRVFSQTAGLRFTRIPFTTVFAESRFQQESYGLFESEIGGEYPELTHNTDATSHLGDLRAGFTTSPWRQVSLTADYHWYDKTTDYDHLFKNVVPGNEGYPAFIRWRELLSNQAEAKLALQWTSWLKTSLTYTWLQNRYRTANDPVTDFSGVAGGFSSGAPLLAGTYDAHNASLNATLNATRRLLFSATFAYQNARTVTAANGSPAVTPYAGNVYTALVDGNYAVNPRLTLAAGYAFSTADFGQGNYSTGLPLGLTYQQHTLQAGFKRELGRGKTLGLEYRFYLYDEPSRGGLDNFHAHALFATFAWRFP